MQIKNALRKSLSVSGIKIDSDFEKNQWLKSEELVRIQRTLVRKLVEEACANVPFWGRTFRDLGLRPSDIKCVSDLEKLPVTSKAMMRGKAEFRSNIIKSMQPFMLHTGGSTGQVFRYYTTGLSRSALDACRIRAWRWAGYKDKDRIATFTGGGLGSSKRKFALDCVGMNEDTMDEYIQLIKKYKIDILRGIPSGLMTFARHVEKRGIDLRKKCVLTTSETLLPEHRKFIGEVLGEVFDGYGANDGGSSAFECSEHNGWHISVDKSVFEVLDRNCEHAAPGEEGILTVTCLYNYGMPWIRYMSNDLAVLTDEKCACGRGLPLMSKIKGRTTDLIVTRNTTMNGTELANHVIGMKLPIKAFQFIQTATERVTMRVAREPGWADSDEGKLINMLHQYDPDLDIRFEYPDDIPTTPAGKSEYVVNMMD
ncbi:MAG: hypothetical protein AYK23_00340 [Candidatus Proteinoplasmatales archaeon SG8-5]|nr:MAG: hypothetical protein AYK23_00340 [Candidatus Proteinoplasmatales archaeon SG8-5]